MRQYENDKYYMIVTGKGKNRKIVSWWYSRYAAITQLNRFILDCGMVDARLIVTQFEPPAHLRARVSDDSEVN